MAASNGIRYGFKCRNCPVAREYGAAKLRAEIEAGKHARKYDWHEVELIAAVTYHVFTARENMSQLAETQDPPF